MIWKRQYQHYLMVLFQIELFIGKGRYLKIKDGIGRSHKTDCFDRYINEMVSTYDFMRNTIEEKYSVFKEIACKVLTFPVWVYYNEPIV